MAPSSSLLSPAAATYTHVNNDLLKTRDLIDVSETELLDKLVDVLRLRTFPSDEE